MTIVVILILAIQMLMTRTVMARIAISKVIRIMLDAVVTVIMCQEDI